MPKTTICRTYEELSALLESNDIKVKAFRNFRNVAVGVNYKYLDEAAPQNKRCNHVLADFVVCNARILLYIVIDVLKNDLAYCDTGPFKISIYQQKKLYLFFHIISDSVIYIVRDGVDKLKTGPLLGELTDELASFAPADTPPDVPTPYIEQFLSSGPKSYLLNVYIPATQSYKQIRKIKGFSLNFNNQEQMGLETLRKLITGELTAVEINQMEQIGRTSTFEVYTTKNRKKNMRLVFNKRRRVGVVNSVPFGTVDTAEELEWPIAKSEYHFREWCA